MGADQTMKKIVVISFLLTLSMTITMGLKTKKQNHKGWHERMVKTMYADVWGIPHTSAQHPHGTATTKSQGPLPDTSQSQLKKQIKAAASRDDFETVAHLAMKLQKAPRLPQKIATIKNAAHHVAKHKGNKKKTVLPLAPIGPHSPKNCPSNSRAHRHHAFRPASSKERRKKTVK